MGALNFGLYKKNPKFSAMQVRELHSDTGVSLRKYGGHPTMSGEVTLETWCVERPEKTAETVVCLFAVDQFVIDCRPPTVIIVELVGVTVEVVDLVSVFSLDSCLKFFL